MTVLVDHGETDQDSGVLYVEGSLTATVEVDLPPNSGVILVFLSGTAGMGLQYKDIEFECEEAEITAVSHSYDGGDEGTWRMVHIVSIGLPEGYTGTLTINVTCGWWDNCMPFNISMVSYYNAFSGVSGESFELQDAVLQDFSPEVHTTSIGIVNELYEGMAMWVGATLGTFVEYSENVSPQADIYRDDWFAKVATAPLADHGNEVIASITEADDFQQMFFAAGFPLYSFDQPAPPEPCILPNMVGMQLEAAESSLEETTFILGDVTEEESEVDEGLVLSQSLSPGEQECGATVNLVVSSGPGGGGFCLECFDVGGQCTSPISSLVSDVLEHVPKASDPQVESVLRDVVIDFLKRTKILHFDHPAISVVEGRSEYPVLNPCGFQVLHIRSATIAGKPIIQTSEEQLDLEWQELSKGFGWRYRFSELPRNCPPEDWRLAESELPGLFYQLSPNDLSLVGIPTVAIASALRLKVVVFPTREVTAIPQWIFNTWHQGIVAGAIGSLKMMPEKPWSDRQAAGAYIDEYSEAVGAAEGSGLRGFRRNDRPHLRTKSWN